MNQDLSAELLVAGHLIKRYPVVISPQTELWVQGSTMKTAYSLPSLVRLTSKWSISRAHRCRASILRREAKFSRYIYKAHCSENYSRGPHIVWIEVLPGEEGKPLTDRQVKVACSCEFWKFWGCDFIAREKGFLSGLPRTNVMPRGIRDPQKRNWICKHLYAAAQSFYKEDPPEDLGPKKKPEPSKLVEKEPEDSKPQPHKPAPHRNIHQPRQPRQLGRP